MAQDTAPTQAAKAKGIQVSGKLLSLDAQQAWSGRLVRVSPLGKKAALAVMTDRRGEFTLPYLEPGTYVVQVGRLARALKIEAGKPVAPLVLLASRDVVDAGDKIPMGQAAVGGGGGSFAVVLLGGALAAVTFGGVTYTVINEDDKRHQEHQEERRDFKNQQAFDQFLKENNLSFTQNGQVRPPN